jgi:hypothetical protein
MIRILLATLVITSARTESAQAIPLAPEEMARSHAWVAARFEGAQARSPSSVDSTDKGQPFFSFIYGGKSSVELLKAWKLQRATYLLTNLDLPGTTRATGQELLTAGLPVVLHVQPGAAIITYKKNP